MTTQLATAGAGQLINVFPSVIGGVPANVCDGRELHSFLSVGKRFASWIRERIKKYGFEEGRDFVCVSQNRESQKLGSDNCFPELGSKELSRRGGHNRVEYHLCLDMAKELSMVENNAQGREARRYFIEMERQALQAAGIASPTSHLDTLLPSEQQTLSEVAHKRAEEVSEPGKALAEIWSRLHRKYRIAKYDQLPRTQLAEAMMYIAGMELRSGRKARTIPLSEAQRKQLARQIHRAHYCQYLREEGSKRAVCNRLRVHFSIRALDELPAENFDEAMALLEEQYRLTNEYQRVVRELGDAFIREVMNNGEPWTPFIKRHLGGLALEARPNWRAMARQLTVQ